VANGQGDGGAIAVTWKKPETKQQAKQVANQARIFACGNATMAAFAVFDSFLREFSNTQWLQISQSTHAIATRAVTRSTSEGSDYSIAERASALSAEFDLDQALQIAAIDLFAKWRNKVAHRDERSTKIVGRDLLLAASDTLHNDYSHFDIKLALNNFDSNKVPVPKEATTLIAIVMNFSRKLDKAAILRVASTEDDISTVANRLLQEYFEATPDRFRNPWSEISELWQGERDRRNRNLEKILAGLGINRNQNPISAPLPQRFISEITDLSREEFAERYCVKKCSAK
tara:strand:- start:1050 stop:1910 length:861 start_codon:yes stop_codon:yes gene_type:complete